MPVGKTILVNLGAGFDDPVHYTGFGDPDKPPPNSRRLRASYSFTN
jgi:hypothetical protein